MADDEEEFRLTAEEPEIAEKPAKAKPYVHEEIIVGPVCRCRSFRYPHFLEAHKALRDEWDWRTPEERGE